MYWINKSLILIVIICCAENVIEAQSTQQSLCPPQELILPCRCAQKVNEIQIWYVKSTKDMLKYKFFMQISYIQFVSQSFSILLYRTQVFAQ